MAAVEISDAAYDLFDEASDATTDKYRQQALERAVAVVVSDVLGTLLDALEGWQQIYQAMGDPAARGVDRCIKHLEGYQEHVDRQAQLYS